VYILICGNGADYIGSTKGLDLRMEQHHLGEGSNFTQKHLRSVRKRKADLKLVTGKERSFDK